MLASTVSPVPGPPVHILETETRRAEPRWISKDVYEIIFPPGAMGLELGPLIKSDDRELDCVILGFYYPLGFDGYQNLENVIHIGDRVEMIDDNKLRGILFVNIVQYLQDRQSFPRKLAIRRVVEEPAIERLVSERVISPLKDDSIILSRMLNSTKKTVPSNNKSPLRMRDENTFNGTEYSSSPTPITPRSSSRRGLQEKSPLRPMTAARSPKRQHNSFFTKNSHINGELKLEINPPVESVQISSPMSPSAVRKLSQQRNQFNSLSTTPGFRNSLASVGAAVGSTAIGAAVSVGSVMFSGAKELVDQASDLFPRYTDQEFGKLVDTRKSLLLELAETAHHLGEVDFLRKSAEGLVSTLKNDLETTRQQVEDKDKEIALLRNELHNQKVDVTKSNQSELERLTTEISTLRETLERERNVHNSQLELYREEQMSFQEELRETFREADKKMQLVENERKEAIQALSESEQNYEILQDKFIAMESRFNDIRNSFEELQHRSEEDRLTVEEARHEAERQRHEAEVARDAAQELCALHESNCLAAERKCEDLQKSLSHAQTELSTVIGQLNDAKLESERLASELTVAQDLAELDRKVIVANDNTHREAMAKLQSLHVSRLADKEEEITSLNSQIVLLQQELSTIIANSSAETDIIRQTAMADVEAKQTELLSIMESANAACAEVLTLQDELKGKNELISSHEQELSHLRDELASALANIERQTFGSDMTKLALENELSAMKLSLETAKMEIEELTRQNKSANALAKENSEKLALLRSSLPLLLDQCAALRDAHIVTSRELTEEILTVSKKSLGLISLSTEQILNQHTIIVGDGAELIAQLRHELSASRDMINELEPRISIAESTVTTLNAKNDSLCEKLATLESSNTTLSADRDSLREALSAAELAVEIAEAETSRILDENSTRVNALSEALSSCRAEVDAAQAEIRSLTTQLIASQDELSTLSATLELREASIVTLSKTIESHEAKISDYQSSSKSLSEKHSNALAALQETIDNLKNTEEITCKELYATQALLSDSQSRAQHLMDEMKLLQSTILSLEERLSQSESDNETILDLKKSLQLTQSQLYEARQEAETAASRCERLVSSLAVCESTATEYKNRYETLQLETTELVSELSSAATRETELLSRCENLTQSLHDAEKRSAEAKSEMELSRQEVAMQLALREAELRDFTAKEIENKVAILLSEAEQSAALRQNVVSEEVYHKAQRQFEETLANELAEAASHHHRALSDAEMKYNQSLSDLKRKHRETLNTRCNALLALVSDLRTSLQETRSSVVSLEELHTITLRTQSSQFEEALATAVSKRTSESSTLSLTMKRCETLTNAIANSEARYLEAMASAATASRRALRLENEVRASQQALDELMATSAATEVTLLECRTSLSSLMAENEELREELERLGYEGEQEKLLVNVKNTQTSILEKETETLRKSMAMATVDLDAAIRERDSALLSVTALQTQVKECEECIKNLRLQIASYEKSASITTEKNQFDSELICTLQSRIQDLNEKLKDLEENSEKNQNNLREEIHNSCQQLTTEKDALREALVRAEESSATLVAEKDALREALVRAEESSATLVAEKDALREALVRAEESSATLVAEKDALREALVRAEESSATLVAEKDALREALVRAEESSATLVAEKDALREALVRAEESSATLVAEKDALREALVIAESSLVEVMAIKEQISDELTDTRSALNEVKIRFEETESILNETRQRLHLESDKLTQSSVASEIQLEQANQRIQSLEESLARTMTEALESIDFLISARDEALSQKNTVEINNSEIVTELEVMKKNVDTLRIERDGALAALADAETLLSDTRTTTASLENQIANLSSELSEAHTSMAKTLSQLTQMQNDLTVTSERAHQAEMAHLDAEKRLCDALEANSLSTDSYIASAISERNSAIASSQKTLKDMEDLSRKLSVITSERDALRIASETAESGMRALEDALVMATEREAEHATVLRSLRAAATDHAGRADAVTARAEKLSHRVFELESSLAKEKTRARELQTALDERLAELEELSAQAAHATNSTRTPPRLNALNGTLNDLGDENRPPLSDLVPSPPIYHHVPDSSVQDEWLDQAIHASLNLHQHITHLLVKYIVTSSDPLFSQLVAIGEIHNILHEIIVQAPLHAQLPRSRMVLELPHQLALRIKPKPFKHSCLVRTLRVQKLVLRAICKFLAAGLRARKARAVVHSQHSIFDMIDDSDCVRISMDGLYLSPPQENNSRVDTANDLSFDTRLDISCCSDEELLMENILH